jgi:outer membrane protein assembly factor BamD
VLGHNFPDSTWYHDAYDLLKGKGLSPHDFGGSWMSTIWHTVVPSSSG